MSRVLHFWGTVASYGWPVVVGGIAIGAAVLIILWNRGKSASSKAKASVVMLALGGGLLVAAVVMLGLVDLIKFLYHSVAAVELPTYGDTARGLIFIFLAGTAYAFWRFGEVAAFVAIGVAGAGCYGIALIWPDWFNRWSIFLTGYGVPPIASTLASYTVIALLVLRKACPVRGRLLKSGGKGK